MSILHLLVTFVLCVLKSQRQLVVENIALRQQVAMLRQSVKRPRPSVADRLFWIIYSRYVNGWRNLLHSLHPDTVERCHQASNLIGRKLAGYNEDGAVIRRITALALFS